MAEAGGNPEIIHSATLPNATPLSPEAAILLKTIRENQMTGKSGGAIGPSAETPVKPAGLANYVERMGVDLKTLPKNLQDDLMRLEGLSDKVEFAEGVKTFFKDLSPVISSQLPADKREGFAKSYAVLQSMVDQGMVTPDAFYNVLSKEADPAVPQEEVKDLVDEIKQEVQQAKIEDRMPDPTVIEAKTNRLGFTGIIRTIMLLIATVLGFGVFKGATSQ